MILTTVIDFRVKRGLPNFVVKLPMRVQPAPEIAIRVCDAARNRIAGEAKILTSPPVTDVDFEH